MYKATQEDIKRSKTVVLEECGKSNKILSENELENLVSNILNISYSIGGGYDEETIRKITKSYIARNL